VLIFWVINCFLVWSKWKNFQSTFLSNCMDFAREWDIMEGSSCNRRSNHNSNSKYCNFYHIRNVARFNYLIYINNLTLIYISYFYIIVILESFCLWAYSFLRQIYLGKLWTHISFFLIIFLVKNLYQLSLRLSSLLFEGINIWLILFTLIFLSFSLLILLF
jgi:hypothetical protein